jgi:hypothetical protein
MGERPFWQAIGWPGPAAAVKLNLPGSQVWQAGLGWWVRRPCGCHFPASVKICENLCPIYEGMDVSGAVSPDLHGRVALI